MRHWLPLTLSLLITGVVCAPAGAQTDARPEAAPPYLSHVEGLVDVIQDGQLERAQGSTPLLDGDEVLTTNGRAEIVFADGTVAHLDRDTRLEVLGPGRLRMTAGRVIIRTSAAAPPIVIDTAAASITLDPRGEYAVAVDDRRLDALVSVARGVADADTWSGRLVIRAGEQADIPQSGAARLVAFNSARWDAFDRWSADRVNQVTLAASARQLPYELRAHGPTLDRHGYWGHHASYGPVWYPRVVAGWRPYFEGRWRHTRYGWTWVGYDPWAWPTHYYGRWGVSAGVWFWIPARTWGPAWVSWAYAPGYVSWAPLGWDGRPVVAISVGLSRGYDPWRVWTVLPAPRLGHRANLRPWIVDGGRLPLTVRTNFAVRSAPERALDRSARSWVDSGRDGRPRAADPSAPVRRAIPRTAGGEAAAGSQEWNRGSRTSDRRDAGAPGSVNPRSPTAAPASTRVTERRQQWSRENAERDREAARQATPRDQFAVPESYWSPRGGGEGRAAGPPRGGAGSTDRGGSRNEAQAPRGDVRGPRGVEPAPGAHESVQAPPGFVPSDRGSASGRPAGRTTARGVQRPGSADAPASPPPGEGAFRPAPRTDSPRGGSGSAGAQAGSGPGGSERAAPRGGSRGGGNAQATPSSRGGGERGNRPGAVRRPPS
jgi:hypothetical protein